MSRREQLLAKLEAMGAGPKRALGQNFLIADGVIEKILMAAESESGGPKECVPQGLPSEVIEIGPGLGALTDGLLAFTEKKKLRFQLIELDSEFAEAWRARGVTVTEADALQVDWKAFALKPGARLVSNLPYQISSSLVIDRSIDPAGLTSMILMFQKEVAKRIAAKAKTEDYGLLSVIAQLGWAVDTVSEAGPGDFYPPPRVASRVLRFRRRADAPAEAEFAKFLSFAKTAYAHRRKLMVKNLEGYRGLTKAQLETEVEAMGFAKTARVEELSPEQVLALFRRLRLEGA